MFDQTENETLLSSPETNSYTLSGKHVFSAVSDRNFYPQRAQRAGGISKGLVISWLWLSLTTLVIGLHKMCGKITKFLGNFEPPYLWPEMS